jgi:hypothetical protein
MNHTTQFSQFQNPLLQPQHPAPKFQWSPSTETTPIEDPRVAMRLVNNLKYLFNIGAGDYLTFVLGHGECSNNDSALKYWVFDQLASSPVSQGDALDYLVTQLKEQIMLEVVQ